MPDKLLDIVLTRSLFTGPWSERRCSWLMHMLLLLGACSLPLYFIHHPDYNSFANLIGTAGYWGLFVALRLGTPFVWVAQGTVLWSVGYVAYLAAMTGGINSPAMVWMTVAILPAVFLLHRRAVLFWLFVVLLTHFALFLISQSGLVNSDVNVSNEAMAWTIANKFLVISWVMSMVFVTEHMHRTQTLAMDESHAELERKQQELMRAQAHKDEFIASVSHELRTPMNAILGLNDILRNELAHEPDDAALVDHIRRSTEQLLQVVNDSLDFSQLQAGRLTLHEAPFAVHETVATTLAAYESRAQAKGLSLVLQDNAVRQMWVKGDRQRLVQVLNNLLDNAIQFTGEGEVVLRVQATEGGLLFEVQDSGIGIAPDRLAHMFKGVDHVDRQTNRPHGGTGLGLSLCERLVRLQGGTLGVNSVLGQGTRFWFQLPLRSIAHEAQAAADMARTLVDKPLQILLVDDNAVNRLVARMMLQTCFPKVTVVEAASGALALEQLRDQSFDLVLMDMVMPDMDGMAVTRILRHDFPAATRHTPVLALTASANPVDHRRCLESGMNDVVHKPLDPQQLMAKIANALAAHAEWSAS